MRVTVFPFTPRGAVKAIASKSDAHRLLLAAALSDKKTVVRCETLSDDIKATVSCLNALCADVTPYAQGFAVTPQTTDSACSLDCGESGSTFRFLLPVACALGKTAQLVLHGRLPERPMEPLFTLLEEHGIRLSGKGTRLLTAEGQLKNGLYKLPGDISSQYITGLLFALPLLLGDSEIVLTSPLQSKPYVDMTLSVLERFGIHIEAYDDTFRIFGGQVYHSPYISITEGDWSNAAFFLCAAAARGSVTVGGLSPLSAQGDRAVCAFLRGFGASVSENENGVTVESGTLKGITVDASENPDLVPALCVVAAAAEGVTHIENAGRLRLKESDRLFTVTQSLSALGADIKETGDGLTVRGTETLRGGTVDAFGDHRIVMACAAAAVLCENPVVIENAEAVNKSYPSFFEDLTALGAKVIKEETA